MEDKEFEARQERNRRLRNAEYEIEDEQRLTQARQEKEKKRMERARKNERLREEKERELRQARRKAAESKKAEQKKQQSDAREIMEQKRAANSATGKGPGKGKKSKGFGIIGATGSATLEVENNATSREITPQTMSANTPLQTMAKDSVQSEIYIDDKKVSEKEAPQDLVRRMRKEREKAIREAEQELKELEEQQSSNQQNKKGFYGNRTGSNGANVAGRRAGGAGAAGAAGAGIAPFMNGGTPYNVGIENQDVNLGNRFGSDDNSTGDISGTASTSPSSRSSNLEHGQGLGDEGADTPQDMPSMASGAGIPLNDREALRQQLANGGNAGARRGNNPNSIFTNPNAPDGDFDDDDDDYLGGGSRQNQDNTARAAAAAAAGAAAASRMRPGRRTGGGTAGTVGPSPMAGSREPSVFSDMQSAGRGAINATKTIAGVGKLAAGTPLGPLLAGGGIIGILIFAIIGGSSFIMNLPGSVRDKVADTWDTKWQQSTGIVSSADSIDTNLTAVKKLADTLETMGCDLVYNGFATSVKKDNDGKIKDIKSKYLASYIAAEEKSYMIANENANAKQIWLGSKDIFDESQKNDWNEKWGTGMIVLEENLLKTLLNGVQWSTSDNPLDFLVGVAGNLSDYFMGETTSRVDGTKDVSSLTTRVRINRTTKELYLSQVDVIDVFNSGGYDVYRYSLKEWSEKYGTPVELFLTLHLATRAPEFAYKFANTYDTKVYLEMKELSDTKVDLVYAETDANNVVKLDKNGKPIMKPVSEMTDAEIKAKGISDEALKEIRNVHEKVVAFTPYITKVLNHWYYQQIIYQGEYNGQKVDVYQTKNLEQGDQGYERYYAYTRRDNSDTGHISSDSEKVEPEADSLFGSALNVCIIALKIYITQGQYLFDMAVDMAVDEVKDYAFEQLNDLTFANFSESLMGLVSNDMSGMFSGQTQYFKNGINTDVLGSTVNLGNMSSMLDFNKVTDSLKLDGMSLDKDKLLGQLNLSSGLGNLDLSGITNVNDLSGLTNNLNLDNLNGAFGKNFADFTDFSGTNLNGFSNFLSAGITSDALGSVQGGILDTFKNSVVGLNDFEWTKFRDMYIDNITDMIADQTSMPILGHLEESISAIVDGKFDNAILGGLQNEFAKQITGLSFGDLGKIADIADMDFDKIKGLSNQVSSITSTLKGVENGISNLTSKVNKLATEATGVDTAVLNSIAGSVTNLGTKVTSLGTDISDMQRIVSSADSSNPNISKLSTQLSNLKDNVNKLEAANDKLVVQEISYYNNEIAKSQREISSTINSLDGIDASDLNNIKNQYNKLNSGTSSVIKDVTSLDIINLEEILKNTKNIGALDKVGLVGLAKDFTTLDVSYNGMKDLVKKYGDDITGLKTSDINSFMSLIDGKNLELEDAYKGVSKYLMSADEADLLGSIGELSDTVGLLDKCTKNLDFDNILKLTDKVIGFGSSELNNFASQISGLDNVNISGLLGNIEKMPQQILNQVSANLTKSITNGIKNQISAGISDNLKNNLLGDDKFIGNLENLLTAGEKFEGEDMESEDQQVELPYAEYSTGFYVREIRKSDYFQVAEPLRVLYPASHWRKMFREDKYVILDGPAVDINKIDDPKYIEEHGMTIWEATNGNPEAAIYAMLQGIQTSDSQYLYRYFKELFTDFAWVFDSNWGFSPTIKPGDVNPDVFGWIFKTAEVDEQIFSGELKKYGDTKEIEVDESVAYNDKLLEQIAKENKPAEADTYTYKCSRFLSDSFSESIDFDAMDPSDFDTTTLYKYVLKIEYFKYEKRETNKVEKAEYEPATWSANSYGMLTPWSEDRVYGFETGLDIVSPVTGVVINKTAGYKNDLGKTVGQSITIELRNTGDENADGMRVIIIGGDFTDTMVGQLVYKKLYEVDSDGNYTGEESNSVIGKTLDEPIKVVLMDKDQTPVQNIAKYIYPPYESNEYKPELGS